MVGRGDYNGVNLVELQQILDVSKDIGNLHSLGDRARLGSIVVAQRDKLGAFDFGERRKVRQLRNRSSANESEPNGLVR